MRPHVAIYNFPVDTGCAVLCKKPVDKILAITLVYPIKSIIQHFLPLFCKICVLPETESGLLWVALRRGAAPVARAEDQAHAEARAGGHFEGLEVPEAGVNDEAVGRLLVKAVALIPVPMAILTRLRVRSSASTSSSSTYPSPLGGRCRCRGRRC
jgi:hypothetical protein